MTEHDVMMAVLFANEAETWLLCIKDYMPNRELKIAVDDAIRANKRVRNLITGRYNLDDITDCSAIFSEIGLRVKKEPSNSAELMALLKAWTDGEVHSEEQWQQKIDNLNENIDMLQGQVAFWQKRYDEEVNSELTVSRVFAVFSHRDIVQMGEDALEKIYKELEWAISNNPTFRATGDPVVVGDAWGEMYFGVIGHKLTKQIKQRKLSNEMLYRMHDFFFDYKEIEYQEERRDVA